MSRSLIETLESRTMLALTAGFENTFILRVATAVASSMEWAPDGRLFVADSRNGEVEVIKFNASLNRWVQNTTPALKLAVDTYAERGIESIVFDPNFATNRYLYIYYTRADPANPNVAGNNARNRLVRVQASASNPDVIDPGSLTVLIDNLIAPGIHNGGAMHFGADGMLYLGIGDAGTSSNAQTLSNLHGKVIRLNTSAFNSTGQISSLIPSDNPFVGQAGARPEIWAYGLRNPFTGAMKPGTNTLFINDVGGSQFEEVNHILKGRNYGWPSAEGNSTNTAFTNPIYSYTHYPNGPFPTPRVQAAITGGVFYDGNQFPASYQGKYFFGDYLRQFIKVLDPATNGVTSFFDPIPDNQEFLDFDVAPDGTLWALSVGGNIHRFRFVGQANRAPVANVSADKTNGLTPLTVNFSGAGSSDPDGDTLSYSWNFDDGTTGTGQMIAHTFDTAGTYDVVLTVNDGKGGTNSKTLVITAGNEAPVATINSPAIGTLYRGGETISYSGSGFDNQDGDLPASAFEWKIVFHHAGHTHPFLDNVNLNGTKSGSFVIPKVGEFAPDQFYRIHLTVTDAGGLKHTTTRDVTPRTSNVTLTTNIAGLDLTLDGAPFDGGTSFTGVELMTRSIGAPTQTLNGKTYEFVSWSDGGAATHNIDTPLNDTTYTATFREVSMTGVSLRATADAYVRGGTSAATNFGNATDLIVKLSSQPEYLRETYLKFDIGSAASIGSAKLRLVGKLADAGATNVPVSVFAVSSTNWSETGITFNNKPGAGAAALASKTITDATTRTYEWDLTNYVKAEKAAGRNIVSFVLRAGRSVNPVITFASDEAASNKPALFITPATTSSTTLGPTHDAYVHAGSPTVNFGNATQLQVKKSSSGFARETYLKFDLSSVATINSAKLRLFGGLSAPWTSAIQTAAYGASNTTWTETGITYNNRPASGATALSTVSISGTTQQYYEWDLTSYLKAEKLAGRNTVTIVLKNLQSGDPFTIFNSSEAATNKPQLVVT